MITSIRVTETTKERLKDISKKYSIKTLDATLIYILDYIERNNLDLKIEFKNEFYDVVKSNEKKFDEFSSTLFKNEERIIKILRRFEIDYLTKILILGNKEANQVIVNNDSNNKFNLNELLEKIEIEESKVTGKIKYYLNISEKELEDLKQNAR